MILFTLPGASARAPASSDGGVAAVEQLFPLNPLFPEPWTEGSEPNLEAMDLWFVEFATPPLADGGRLNQIQRDKANFRSAAAQAGLQYTERFAFDTLWNGLSIQIDPSQLSQLARIPGVLTLYPVVTVSVPDISPDVGADLATALAMTGADVAQSELGFTGAGIRAAIMDTGIDYNHPDLGACSFLLEEGCRVVTGFDFVGDDFHAGSTDPERRIPQLDPDPMDCFGHGTHVAGIVGASGGVVGVAPGVAFGAYKVFGCEGSTFADIMIAAMEMALKDEMDVLNMSIGAAFQWPQYPTAVASDRLVNMGMVVVASIGNSGANGVYSTGAPGVGKKVIGVGSVDNTHVQLSVFEVEGEQIGFIPMSGALPAPTEGTEEIVFIGRACTEDELLGDPDGKVALIIRGVCTFREKALNAIDAGATAVLVHNHLPGIFAGTVGTPPLGIPVVGISLADGEFIRSVEPPVSLTWTDERGIFPNPTGGLTSSFSSYGLSPDLDLKPDITAPGGSIFSTFPLAQGSYATLSGTSMSSPHVAGAVALLLEARPNTPSQAVRGILQNSADPIVWWGIPTGPFLDNVHRQGAGLLDIPGAIQAMTKIEPGKLSLGESEAGPAVRTLTIENKGSTAVTYTLSHSPALSTGLSTFSPSFFTGFATVAFSTPSVTVPAGDTATVEVTITAHPGLPDRSQYGGYLVFSPSNGDAVYRVPYAGFKGDYQSILVLNPAASAFGNPVLRSTLSFGPSEPVTFDPDAGEVAFLLFHLDHQVRRIRAEVFDADTGKAWHRAFEFQYVGRNSGPTAFFFVTWDGVTTNGRRVNDLPDGNYVIRLSIQKALGGDNNLDHWEIWTSPVITIARSV